MALGLNGQDLSTNKASRMDMSRNSMDSGYHSVTARPRCRSQNSLSSVTQFRTQGSESSPEPSPRKLHKTISTTFSEAMQAFSKTVRASTSYIYPNAGEPELPSSEWAECETPKKESHRSSLMSSVRSRKQRYTPQASTVRIKSPKTPKSPVPKTQENAPALDVEPPNSTSNDESSDQVSGSSAPQLLTGVKLPRRSKKLWPGPTRLSTNQASGKDRQAVLDPILPDLEDPYVEQRGRSPHGLTFIDSSSESAFKSACPIFRKRHITDDSGYVSEMENKAVITASDRLSPARLKDMTSKSPEARTSALCHHKDPVASRVRVPPSTSPRDRSIPPRMSSTKPSGPETSKANTSNGTADSNTLDDNLNQRPNLEEGRDACLSFDDGTSTLRLRPSYDRPIRHVYHADEESLKTSMGSRDAWERHRADRERRYMEIVDMALETESDEEVEHGLELKRSPSKKPVHYAQKSDQATVNAESPKSEFKDPKGELHYAVEAVDKAALPVSDLAYAVEAIERPSVTTFDPLETVFQQRPMLCVSDMIDEPEAFEASIPLDVSSSCKEISPSRNAALSPSRVELPSSPAPSSVEVPTYSKSGTRMTNFPDEEPTTLGAAYPKDESIRRSSSKPSHIPSHASPGRRFNTASRTTREGGLKPSDLLFMAKASLSSETNSMGEDAYRAGLRAAGFSTPIRIKETSPSTNRERFEAGSAVPKQRARLAAPVMDHEMSPVLSDDTDISCVNKPPSPSWNAPPPFPGLNFRSELSQRRQNSEDALANYDDDQIRVAESQNANINLTPSSPFDVSEGPAYLAESEPFSSIISEWANPPQIQAQASSPMSFDLPSPSTGNASSICSFSDSSITQEAFNAAKLPNFASSPVVASRKARRKQKKRSRGVESFSSVDFTKDARNITSEPDFSLTPHRRELSKNSDFDAMSISPGEWTRVRDPRSVDRKKTCSEIQKLFDEYFEEGGGDGWLKEPRQ